MRFPMNKEYQIADIQSLVKKLDLMDAGCPQKPFTETERLAFLDGWRPERWVDQYLKFMTTGSMQ